MINQQQGQGQKQPKIKYKCTLLSEINQCPFYIAEGSLCNKADDENNFGTGSCAFKQSLAEKPRELYEREPRWYEKLYKEKNNSKQNGQYENGKERFPFT